MPFRSIHPLRASIFVNPSDNRISGASRTANPAQAGDAKPTGPGQSGRPGCQASKPLSPRRREAGVGSLFFERKRCGKSGGRQVQHWGRWPFPSPRAARAGNCASLPRRARAVQRCRNHGGNSPSRSDWSPFTGRQCPWARPRRSLSRDASDRDIVRRDAGLRAVRRHDHVHRRGSRPDGECADHVGQP